MIIKEPRKIVLNVLKNANYGNKNKKNLIIFIINLIILNSLSHERCTECVSDRVLNRFSGKCEC